MSNNSQNNQTSIGKLMAFFGHRRFFAVFVTMIVIVLLSVSLSSAFLSPDTPSSSQASPTPSSVTNPTETPTPAPTATPTHSPTPSPTLIPVPVNFTVNGLYNVSVAVDLNDRMNRDEAILVAERIFNGVHAHATYEVKSAEVNGRGVWTVSLPWGAVYNDGLQEDHSHFFAATIDPATRTATIATCF